MATNSIFNCCNGFQSIDNAQTSLVTISRNNYIKNKKLQILHSPKASLKSLTSLKSVKNLQNCAYSSQMHLASTRDIVNQCPTKYQNKVSSNILTPQRYININRQFYLSPSVNKDIIMTSSIPKQKIFFSYNDPRNPQNIKPIYLTPINRSEIRPTRVKTQVQYSTPSIKNVQEQNILKISQNKLKQSQNKGLSKSSRISIKKSDIIQKKQQAAPIKQSRIHLGGSKYTIISQDDMDQGNDKQPRMQESAIIVNVFNPTKSQMQKWDVKQQKLSYFGKPQPKSKQAKSQLQN